MDIFDPCMPAACQVFKEAANAALMPDVLHVCREMQVFEFFQQGRRREEFLRWGGEDQLTAGRLLDVLIQGGLVAKTQEEYRATAAAEFFFRSGQLFSIGGLLPPPTIFAAQLRTALRGNGQESAVPEWGRERLLNIGSSSLLGAVQETLALGGLTGRKSLLDLGGGHGLYSVGFAQKYPELDITLLDLPAVVPVARETAAYFGRTDRIRMVEGDFMSGEIGSDFDVVFCANVIGPRNLPQVLPTIRRALCPGGILQVRNRVADVTDCLDNALAKLVWAVRGGRELWTREQWRCVVEENGFRNFKTEGVFGIFAVMSAEKK